jgi:hypothetical protein
MAKPEWPFPRPDPEREPGEDRVSHLLPNRDRLRRMTREQRRDLLERVADWDGPLVVRFRAWVAELESTDQ